MKLRTDLVQRVPALNSAAVRRRGRQARVSRRLAGSLASGRLMAALGIGFPASGAASASGARRCTPEQLGTRGVTGAVGLGHAVIEFAFVNHGPGTCTLLGYPKLQLLSAAGRALTTIARNSRPCGLVSITSVSARQLLVNPEESEEK